MKRMYKVEYHFEHNGALGCPLARFMYGDSAKEVEDKLKQTEDKEHLNRLSIDHIEDWTSRYEEEGFANREEYLDSLSSEYAKEFVLTLASVLGPGEDFDGLISSLEGMQW